MVSRDYIDISPDNSADMVMSNGNLTKDGIYDKELAYFGQKED